VEGRRVSKRAPKPAGAIRTELSGGSPIQADAGRLQTWEGVASAAKTMADRWRQQHAVVAQRWSDYERAAAEEEAIRTESHEMLRTLATCAAALAEVDGTVVEWAPVLTDGVTPGTSGANSGGGPTPPGQASAPPDVPQAVGLAVCLLGSFRMFRKGRPVETWPGTRTPRIIRRIAAQGGRPVPREVLIDLFWPDADVETGRRNLHQAVYQIRSALRDELDVHTAIIYHNDAYSLNGQLGTWCDVEVFEGHIRAGRAAMRTGRTGDAIDELRAAERRYEGDYLEDTPYEDWAVAERVRLRELYLAGANQLADLYLEEGDTDSALDATHRVLAREPSDERANRRAMQCYAISGQRNLLVRQYVTCTESIEQACGLEPTAETAALYAALIDELDHHTQAAPSRYRSR
jgi:DNA-binding SARP family transcriptional activator